MRTIDGKVVLVTGAGSGFGRCLALQMAQRGAIPILADISEEGLAETGRLLEEQGARFDAHKLDIRDPDAWAQVAAAVAGKFGRIDVLVNNAGVLSRAQSFFELDIKHCQFVIDVNFWGMVHGTRALLPYLGKRPEAHIVNTSSSLALIGAPMHSVYCASKAAVANYTAVIREELRGTNIGVTTVFPGASRTNLGRNVSADSKAEREANAKNFERFATTAPEKVADQIINAILRNRPIVVTGADGRAHSVFQRIAPRLGWRIMSYAYRRISDPKLFEHLDGLKRS